jgi:hypothetical protein
LYRARKSENHGLFLEGGMEMKLNLTLAVLATLALAAGSAHAAPFTSTELGDLLAGYDFGTQNGATYQDSFVAQANTSVSQIDATVGLNSSTRGSGATDGPWTSSPSDTNDLPSGQTRANYTSDWTGDTDFLGAVNLGEYYNFSVAADAGYLLSLSEIGFLIRNDGSSAADSFQVWMSTDGFDSFTGTATTNSTFVGTGLIESQGATSSNYGTTDVFALADSVDQVEFRIYIYGEDGNSSQSTRIDKVYLDGNVVIPEPATMSLLALGGLAVLRRRRR